MKLNIIFAINVGLSTIAVSRNRRLKFQDEHLTLFPSGGANIAPPPKVFANISETVCDRLLKLSDFSQN